MSPALAFALLSGALFGLTSPLIRIAMRRGAGSEAGAALMLVAAFAACAVGAAAELLRGEGLPLLQLLPYAAAGIVAPGLAQLLFTRGVRLAGAARCSVTVGAAPLVSVAIAIVVLGEPAQWALLLGAALIVLGGAFLVGERVRPEGFASAGLALAFGSAVLFSARDNFVRWLSGHAAGTPPLTAGAVSTATAAVFLLGRLAYARGPRGMREELGRAVPFALPGLSMGISYVTLFEAYFHGRVTVVSPLVATESLWGVATTWLLIGATERVGVWMLSGAALVVAGGALIGAVH